MSDDVYKWVDTASFSESRFGLIVPCLVCEEPIKISYLEAKHTSKICDKCKRAVMHVRSELEKGN